jgi:hypothetical protein
MLRVCVLVVSLVLVACGFVGAAQNTLVPLDEVPQAVVDAGKVAAPGVDFLLAFKSPTGRYIMVGTDSLGRVVRFNPTAEGEDGAVYVEISKDDVPLVVQAALMNEIPGFEPETIEACGANISEVIVYRFVGKGFLGETVEVYVSPNGMKVTRVE